MHLILIQTCSGTLVFLVPELKKKLPYHGRLSRGVDVGVYLSIYLSCKEIFFTVRGANARGCEQCGSTTNGERSATL